MRIIIQNRKAVSAFLKERNIRKEHLAKALKVNYWNLIHWLNGRSIPEEVFLNLIKIYPALRSLSEYKNFSEEEARIRGGRNSFNKKSRKDVLSLVRKMWKARNTQIEVHLKEVDKNFCELYGIMLGDGCLSRFKGDKGRIRYAIFITGNSKNDIKYYENNLIPLFNKLFNISPRIYHRKDCNALQIDVRIRSLVKIFSSFGFPLGKKGEIVIPNKILRLGTSYTNRVIRGIFDTDGCFYARKDEDYKYPHIAITSSSKKLREQLKSILNKEGFAACIHSTNVIVRGINNINKWFKLIGSSHPVTLERYNNWKKYKKLPPRG